MPAGFHMIPISMGIYQVTYPELGDYQFQCTTHDNDNLEGTGTIIISVVQGTSLYLFINKINCTYGYLLLIAQVLFFFSVSLNNQ